MQPVLGEDVRQRKARDARKRTVVAEFSPRAALAGCITGGGAKFILEIEKNVVQRGEYFSVKIAKSLHVNGSPNISPDE